MGIEDVYHGWAPVVVDTDVVVESKAFSSVFFAEASIVALVDTRGAINVMDAIATPAPNAQVNEGFSALTIEAVLGEVFGLFRPRSLTGGR